MAKFFNKVVWTVAGTAVLVVLGLFGYGALYAGKTIHELLGENKVLKQSISNLTEEQVVGYAKVLSQEERNGALYTRFLFVMTDAKDQTKRILEKEFEVEGDVVFFDALIVKFGTKVVMDGRERAMFLWRRIYSEKTAPENGFPIEEPGVAPARYSALCEKLSITDRDMFWSAIWKLSDDPEGLARSDVRALYGNAVYKKIQPGLIYKFTIDAGGTFFPESYPAL